MPISENMVQEIVPGNTASEFGCYYLDANEAVKAESNNSENTF